MQENIKQMNYSNRLETRRSQSKGGFVGEFTVELIIEKSDLQIWQQICSDLFQKSLLQLNFQEIDLFDRMLIELESIEAKEPETGSLRFTLPELHCFLMMLDASKRQYRAEANLELYRMAEACEIELLEIAIPYQTQLVMISNKLSAVR